MKSNNPKVDQAAPAAIVVGKWPSLYKFARDTGFAPGTVYRWMESGFIPGKYHTQIIAKGAAATPKVKVLPTDFADHRKVQVDA